MTSQWRHNGRDSISNHKPRDCLLNRLFRCKSKKTWKLRVTGLCAGNSPGTGEFPAQMASNAESVCIWWRHHEVTALWTISQTVYELITEILRKMNSAVILVLMMQSGHNFAHAMTAQLNGARPSADTVCWLQSLLAMCFIPSFCRYHWFQMIFHWGDDVTQNGRHDLLKSNVISKAA